MAETDLPYRAEYAKSGRSACQVCKAKIEKDYLRLATIVQSPVFDGKITKWFHFECFFLKQRPKAVGDISHFESLRWEDQEKIRQKVLSSAGASSSKNGTASKTTTKRKLERTASSGEFKIEYSVSSRATCRGCDVTIAKGEVRACVIDRESDEGRRYNGVPLWHHFDCFVKVRQDLEFWDSGEQLSGFKSLKTEDQNRVKAALRAIEPVKKESSNEQPAKKSKVEDKSAIVKKQNKLMFQYRDILKTLSKKELVALLQKNKQEIPVGTERMLDRLSDIMTFGALQSCPTCKKGQLVFRSGVGYQCLAEGEWAKCQSVCDEPPRKPFIVPEDLKEEYDFLAKYKGKVVKRVFEKNAPSASTLAKSNSTLLQGMKSEPGTSGPKLDRKAPLKGMEFCLVGKFDNKDDIKGRIIKLGGSVRPKVESAITAVISDPEMIEKNGVYIRAAREHNIQIVPEKFIDECEKGSDAVATINRLNLVEWGADPTVRIASTMAKSVAKSQKSSSKYKSNVSTVRLQVQNGVAVDPDSELGMIAHVYRDPQGNVYNASLAVSDIQTGKNSYYKLQVLEANSMDRYWLFRSWGRIGTTIGSHKEERMEREEAIDSFKNLFYEKSCNMWENRKNFKKVPGKMAMVDVTYDDDEVDATVGDVPSKLEPAVQVIMKMLFDTDAMKDVLKEMEIDLQKMPLGKLSKKHIEQAYRVLTELQNCLAAKDGKAIENQKLIGYTNQFFSLIPHDFGIDNPPLLNDLDVIKQKTEMLDSLMGIELTYSLLRKSDEGDTAVSKLDTHYRSLKADLRPMQRSEPEFETLQLYMKNTHAATHRNYELEILEMFKVERHGESERFNKFKSLHNRKLLWHGSRVTNFAGILAQGLRIAPPEAPVTGYMFGKGIYFADMVSKSANYCMTNPSNNVGLLLLCEVALGNMHELFHAQNIVKPPKGKHSVKGIGKTQPDPTVTKMLDDGVEIPLGPAVPSEHKDTGLLYNEYIVYDVAQVKVRYLVQVKFNFGY